AGVDPPPDDARQREPPVTGRYSGAQMARRADGEALLRRGRGKAGGLRAADDLAPPRRRASDIGNRAHGARSNTSTSASAPLASTIRRSPSSSAASPAPNRWPLTSSAPRTTCT